MGYNLKAANRQGIANTIFVDRPAAKIFGIADQRSAPPGPPETERACHSGEQLSINEVYSRLPKSQRPSGARTPARSIRPRLLSLNAVPKGFGL